MAARTALIGAALLAVGCAALPSASPPLPRVSELAAQGDGPSRASQRLVIEGLDADERGDAKRARSRYERALTVDPSNPWAYLALARHYVQMGEAGAAMSHLDRAEALLESQDVPSPGAKVYCDGLRGAAFALEGNQSAARPLLDSAARSAPDVWGDGQLSASELR